MMEGGVDRNDEGLAWLSVLKGSLLRHFFLQPPELQINYVTHDVKSHITHCMRWSNNWGHSKWESYRCHIKIKVLQNVYILAGCANIFIKFMEKEEGHRVERYRLQKVTTTCFSACAHFWPVPSWRSQQACLWLPGAPKSWAGSLTCHVFFVHCHFLLLWFPGIASTVLPMPDQSRIIHIGPSYSYWLSDDMSPAHYLNCGPDRRKLCSLAIYTLSFR